MWQTKKILMDIADLNEFKFNYFFFSFFLSFKLSFSLSPIINIFIHFKLKISGSCPGAAAITPGTRSSAVSSATTTRQMQYRVT